MLEAVSTVIKKSLTEFERRLGFGVYSQTAFVCKLVDVLDEGDTDHTCIPCNLLDSLQDIYSFLSKYNYSDETSDNNRCFFKQYIMLLYLHTELLDVYINILGLPQKYRDDNMAILREVKRWANFFKHPKSMALAHHPLFIFKDSLSMNVIPNKYIERHNGPDDPKYMPNIFTYRDIESFYTGEKEGLAKNLSDRIKKYSHSKDKIYIILPNPMRITTDFCELNLLFMNLVRNNPIYIEILKDESLVRDYFDSTIGSNNES